MKSTLASLLAYWSQYTLRFLNICKALLFVNTGIATGRRHAGIYCNNEGLETAVVAAGKTSGNMAHPLLYCPGPSLCVFLLWSTAVSQNVALILWK